jgi:hypothetical protein
VAYGALGSQVLLKLSFQCATRLNEKAFVDGLEGHLAVLVIRISTLQPAGELFGRPQSSELQCHQAGQCAIQHEFTGLGTVRSIPGGLIRLAGPVALQATVAVHFPTDRRRSATQSDCDRT